MAKGKILRLDAARKRRGKRSGRFSTQEIYRAAVGAQEAEAESGRAPRPTIRLLPPFELEKDREGMATDYRVRLGKGEIAKVRLTEEAKRHFHVDWVFVPPKFRADGYGRRLMDRVLADADTHRVKLTLEARACAGLSQEQLETWYRGFGFVLTDERGPLGVIMVREPATRRYRRRAA